MPDNDVPKPRCPRCPNVCSHTHTQNTRISHPGTPTPSAVLGSECSTCMEMVSPPLTEGRDCADFSHVARSAPNDARNKEDLVLAHGNLLFSPTFSGLWKP